MVVMDAPTTALMGVMQERVARPSTRTVQAPQAPMPQPYLAPLRSRVSRKAQRRGVSGGRSTEVRTLLILSFRGMGHTLFTRWRILVRRNAIGTNFRCNWGEM